MELMQLRYFLEAAEEQHMTAAAEKLHIAQPALTQAVNRLEKEIGVPLFEKRGRGVVLTRCGLYAKEKLAPLLRSLDSLPAELREIAEEENRTVCIHVLAASSLLTKAIIRFQEQNKEARFRLVQNESSDPFDIRITTRLFYQQKEGDEERQFIYNEKIFLAVPDGGVYAGRSSVRLKELEGEGFITLAGSRQFRYICDRFCHYAGLRPNYVFESDSPAAVQDMIAANMGVGFWPEHSWGKIANEKIRLLPISEPECSRDLIVSLNGQTDSRYAAEFFAFLKSTLTEA